MFMCESCICKEQGLESYFIMRPSRGRCEVCKKNAECEDNHFDPPAKPEIPKPKNMILEIANPSDPYTMVTPDKGAAAVACVLLGSGHYMLKEYKGDFKVPFFMFGGHDEWFKENFGKDATGTMSEYTEGEKRLLLIQALESVAYGSPSDREDFDDACAAITDPAKRSDFIAKRHDRHRSSTNDIGGYAQRLAAGLKKKLEEAETA